MIEEIIKREYQFLDKVKNIGGRAGCQDDFENFYKYRKSQFEAYDKESLESYIEDLKQYQEINYNPIMLKYAYMMESNDTKEFEKFKSKLPQREEIDQKLINQLVEIQLGMREEFNEKYPNVSAQARNTYAIDDNQNDTSFETYLKAELSTYSPKTLFLYAKMLLKKAQENKNIVIEIQENTARNFGYKSLEEAEESLK